MPYPSFKDYQPDPPVMSEVSSHAASVYVDNAVERGRIRVGRCGTLIMGAFKLLMEKHEDEYDEIVRKMVAEETDYYNRHLPTDHRTMGEQLTDRGL